MKRTFRFLGVDEKPDKKFGDQVTLDPVTPHQAWDLATGDGTKTVQELRDEVRLSGHLLVYRRPV